MYKVLILEDDVDLSEILSIYLKKSSYDCVVANTYREAVDFFQQMEFDIIVTDMMLPDGDGETFCTLIRKTKSTPIIVISCLGDDATIVSAFNAGADDYITKPISHAQFMARINANIRRSVHYNSWVDHNNALISRNETVEFCGMILNLRYRTIQTCQGELELSPIEFSILSLFLENPEKLITYNNIYEFVWGKNSLGDYRSVMVHVSNLKKKIDSKNSRIITNVRGSGYLFSLK